MRGSLRSSENIYSPLRTGSFLIQSHYSQTSDVGNYLGETSWQGGQSTRWGIREHSSRSLCGYVFARLRIASIMITGTSDVSNLWTTANNWLTGCWLHVPENRLLAAVLGVSSSLVTCERRNKMGAREQLGFLPLVVGKGCDLNSSACILMLRISQM